MQEEMKAQFLKLENNSDDKKWVAEIVGEDPTFKLSRIFLPEVEKGVYAIFDGIYQIHGIHPGITPFNKEYCRVHHGHMQRNLSMQDVLQKVPELMAEEPRRNARIKYQIRGILEEITQAVDHELIRNNMEYQIEQLDNLEETKSLMATLSQLIKQKDQMIKHYQKLLTTEQGYE